MDTPLTNAEKQKRYRQRLIEKHGADAIRNKDKARKKQKREEKLTVSREKKRIRQQKYRANKAGKISKSPAFKSKTTLTKAVKQASEAPPKPPRKPKWQNMQNLYQEQGGELSLLRRSNVLRISTKGATILVKLQENETQSK